MRYLLILVFLFSCKKQYSDQLAQQEIVGVSQQVPIQSAVNEPFVKNEVLVKFKKGFQDHSFLKNTVVKEHVVTGAMQSSGDEGFFILMVPDVSNAIDALKRNPNVEWASPNWNYSVGAFAPTNDTYWSSLWGVVNSKADISWNAGNTGDQKVYIGVIDEGIQYWHEDLCGQIWVNPYETANGKDDDGNGYIDDINGFDFMHMDNTIFDNQDDHGTHVAGTIAGLANNSKGVVGISPNVTLISGKFLENSGTTADAVKAIDYMTDLKTRHGLNIAATSNSWGGGGYSQALYDAINRARAADILFVAAAGNDGINTDLFPNYPSCYNLDNIISVAAYNSSEQLPSWTNTGSISVDIGAPGVSIMSTLPGTGGSSTYGSYSGTSMATPHVTGAVALYKAGRPTANYSQVKTAILNSARSIPALYGKCLTGGAINVETFTAKTTNTQISRTCVVPAIDATPPTAPTNVKEVSRTSNSATISWSAATDNVGIAKYTISVKYSWFTSTWTVNGATLQLTVTDLTGGVRYPVTIKAYDSWGNVSPSASYTIDFGNDVTPPSTPQNFKVVGLTSTSVSFSYDWSTDDWSGVALYRISYRRADCLECTWSKWSTNGVNPLEVPRLATSVQYAFTIAAMDNNYNWSAESPQVLETPRVITDNEPPTAPIVSVASKTLNSVTLGWTGSVDNIGVTEYEIYYRPTGQNSYYIAGKTPKSPYTVTGLNNATSYDFYVKAYDYSLNSSSSNVITTSTNNPFYAISTTLSGSVSKKTNHVLKWSTSISPSGWQILRSDLQHYRNGWWTVLYSTQTLTGSYVNITSNINTQYYRVVTYLASGEVSYSNELALRSR